MPLQIAPAKTQAPGIKGLLLGPSGVGKTSQLRTLDPATTLFVDLEAGGLSIAGWEGDRLDVFAEAQRMGAPVWEIARGLACWLGGPSPFASAGKTYSAEDWKIMCEAFGDPAPVLEKYQTIFVDSITVASRACFAWCQTQPEAFSEKTGKPDIRGAYGLLGREMVGWLTQWQHIPGKNVWMVGILDRVKDDYGRAEWKPQIMGAGTAQAMPGIVDQIVSMVEMKDESGAPYRAFVCHTLNPDGYPAKDRSSRLDMIEEPNLGKLLAKIAAGGERQSLTYSMPAGSAAVAS